MSTGNFVSQSCKNLCPILQKSPSSEIPTYAPEPPLKREGMPSDLQSQKTLDGPRLGFV